MRILVVEDNDMVRNSLAQYLEEQFFVVDQSSTGEKGSYLARTNEYDAIILDYMLPDKDGSEICHELRTSGNMVPVLILSALTNVAGKIKLLELGADDYITKPFLLKEIHARLRAVLRRPKVIVPDVVTFGRLSIDSNRHKVTYGEIEIYLTKKEFALLEYLARNAEMVLSRGMILEHVWSADSDPFSNTLEAHIFNLRKKMLTVTTSMIIHTIPGRGYKLSDTQMLNNTVL